MDRSASPPNRDRLDPVLLHARREAWVILGAFAVCLVWSITTSYLLGYGEPVSGTVTTVLGIPSWIFWGVVVPWLAADLFAVWFCFFFMANDPLNEAEDTARQNPTAADNHLEGRHD